MNRVKAFTIMEVSIVLVLVGIITTIIFKGVVMFNEQLVNDSKMKQEISEFYIFRANLYTELLNCDKFIKDDSGIKFLGKQEVKYSKENDGLLREKQGQEKLFKYEVNELNIKQVNQDSIFYLNIDWKEGEMEFSFPLKQNTASQINNYFSNFDRTRIK